MLGNGRLLPTRYSIVLLNFANHKILEFVHPYMFQITREMDLEKVLEINDIKLSYRLVNNKIGRASSYYRS